MTGNRNSQFLAISAAAEKALRHRTWKWCRLDNNFLDLPIWRVVAGRANQPLYAIQAFVTRLESFGNAAEPRGYVGDFNAEEFGVALGMTADDAARIFNTLCDPAVGWIDQEHIATFYRRNPDKVDETAAERKRRERARKDIRKKLARLDRLDRLVRDERVLIEALLEGLSDDDLKRLQLRITNALSTGHDGHIVSLRDIVTVTPREDQNLETGAVDNSAILTSGETAELPIEEAIPDDALSTEAETWLATEAVRIVVERMQVERPRATMLIERWRRDLEGDGPAMVRIISGADAAQLSVARFHVAVTDQVRRHIVTKQMGPALHLPPVLHGPATAAPVQRVVADEPPIEADTTTERRKAANE